MKRFIKSLLLVYKALAVFAFFAILACGPAVLCLILDNQLYALIYIITLPIAVAIINVEMEKENDTTNL